MGLVLGGLDRMTNGNGEGTPQTKWDELFASTDFQPLGRYRKARRTRIYKLRDVNHGAELWVVAEEGGKTENARKIVTFENPDDVAPFMADVDRELRAGGWLPV